MTIAALAMAALAVPATLYIARPVPRPAVTRLDVVTPATDDPSSFALSPDGQRLAFVANSDKGSRIWLRLLDQGTTEPVAETEGASFPFWSPDSRSLAFFADGLLKRLDLEGGRPQLLAQARNPLGGAWNRDGDILFAPFPAGALMRVRATGGIPVAATHLLTGERSHGFPAFLPDGRRFIFHVGQSEPESEGLYLESLDTPGSRRRLIASPSAAEYLPPGYLVLVRQGSLMAAPFDPVRATVSGPQLQIASGVAVGDGRGAFSASAAGMLAYRVGPARDRRVSQRLSWINRQGEIRGNLASGNYPQLTRDGKNVAFIGNSQGNTDVYLIASAQGGVPTRFTSHTAIEISSVWSPNGDRLAFASNRGGTFDLFEKPTSLTRDEEPRFASSDNKHPVDWSRNDVLLYVVQDAGGGDDLWTLTLDGNAPSPRRLFHTPHSEDQGQFSPDGRWIAYRSNETGRREIFVRPFPGPGSQRQVSVSGGGHPRWRTDGSELYYIAADGRLTAVPIKLGASSETVDTGVPSPLFVTRLAAPTNAQFGYAVAPDGRFLVSVDGDEPSTSPITIVQNWTAVKQ
jgi:Tol biopolymer transport system component